MYRIDEDDSSENAFVKELKSKTSQRRTGSDQEQGKNSRLVQELKMTTVQRYEPGEGLSCHVNKKGTATIKQTLSSIFVPCLLDDNPDPTLLANYWPPYKFEEAVYGRLYRLISCSGVSFLS